MAGVQRIPLFLRSRAFSGIQSLMLAEQEAGIAAAESAQFRHQQTTVGTEQRASSSAQNQRRQQHGPLQYWQQQSGWGRAVSTTSTHLHQEQTATQTTPTVLASLQARSAPRLGAQLVTTTLLQDFVQHPTIAVWDIFSEMLHEQVPSRILGLRNQLQNIMQRLKAAHPQTDISALQEVVDHVCSRLSTEAHLFVEYCMAPRCPVPAVRPVAHAEPAADAQPLTGEAAALAGCTDFGEPTLAFAVAQVR